MIRAIDTNVLVRYLIEDDLQQTHAATEVIKAGCFLSLTVLLETVWLLSSRYGFPRAVIADTLDQVVKIPSLRTLDDGLIGWAIERFRQGADFADMAHIIDGRPADEFATFDRSIVKLAGGNAPMPIETLTA
jgi:predicted nucleic-acid-binding protein